MSSQSVAGLHTIGAAECAFLVPGVRASLTDDRHSRRANPFLREFHRPRQRFVLRAMMLPLLKTLGGRGALELASIT